METSFKLDFRSSQEPGSWFFLPTGFFFCFEFQLFDYFLLNNVFCYHNLFQEVDEFDSFYKGRMQELGYSSIYMKRSGEKKRDGCGLFYKHDRYVQLFLENSTRL